MKKTLTTLLAVALLSCMGAGAATQQYSITLQPFSDVAISDEFQVSLVRGSDFRALLSVEEAFKDYVTCEVNGSVLNISLDERSVPVDVKRQFRGKGSPDPMFSVVVYVPDLVKSVTLSEKAVLRDTEDLFDKASVSFELSGSSSVKQLTVSSQSVKIKMQQKSSADFKVSCKLLNVETYNSSVLILDETSEESSYSMLGTSKVNSKCRTSHVKVYTKANCTMSLYGSGDSAEFNINGTSEVDASSFEVPDAKVNMSSVCKLSEAAYRTLTVNLNGGCTLLFANNPSFTIENIKSATVSRLGGDRNSSRL